MTRLGGRAHWRAPRASRRALDDIPATRVRTAAPGSSAAACTTPRTWRRLSLEHRVRRHRPRDGGAHAGRHAAYGALRVEKCLAGASAAVLPTPPGARTSLRGTAGADS